VKFLPSNAFFHRLTSEKHIILVCNSVPYNVGVRVTRSYLGLFAIDLIGKMAEVSLTVILLVGIRLCSSHFTCWMVFIHI